MIRVGFSTTSKWISMLVRFWTKSEVSHAFLSYYDDTLDQEMVLDVAFDGFQAVPWSSFQEENQIVELFELPVDMSPGLKTVARWLGKKYSWATFLRFSRFFRIFLKHPVANYKEFICSEVVVIALRVSGYPGADKLDPQETSPQQLYEFLKYKR